MVDSLWQEGPARGNSTGFGVSQTWVQIQLSHLVSVWALGKLWAPSQPQSHQPLQVGPQPLPYRVITGLDGTEDLSHQALCQASWKKGRMEGTISGIAQTKSFTWRPLIPEERHTAKGNWKEFSLHFTLE